MTDALHFTRDRCATFATGESRDSKGDCRPRIESVSEKSSTTTGAARYCLATGAAAAHRLRILQRIYGPGARSLLTRAGIQRGMRVADLGCGVGTVTTLLGELVGPEGEAVGIDVSHAQIEQARRILPGGFSHVSFIEAGANDTGLPPETFDLVYCRFLLIHLTEPERALREMHRLLKPNGILVCEDGDLTSAGSEPPSVLDCFGDLFGRLGPVKGLDYTLGRRLFHLVLNANFRRPEISFNQPVFCRGENKRLLELSVLEAGPAFVEAGLLTFAELYRVVAEMQRIAEDDTVLAVMPRMSQVWARKSVKKTGELLRVA
jgi:SAM-dependent methyltransferase